MAGLDLQIVICTWNRADGLDAVLTRLAGQALAPLAWGVLVVDNASTDHTMTVVEDHMARGLIPIAYVYEAEQGLTPARLRGARESQAPWIAYVDDDNLLEPGWIAAIARGIARHPDAGALGGRAILDWEGGRPEWAQAFGFCFAEQELGEAEREVESLVGAGLVVRRQALADCGWLDAPLLPDRVGESLASGGDAEIAARVRGLGLALWYLPDAVMRHRMPEGRATRRYLLRIARALGAASQVVGLLACDDPFALWREAREREAQARLRQAVAGLGWSLTHGREVTAAFAWLALARGLRDGLDEIDGWGPEKRARIAGRAALSLRRPAGPRLPSAAA